MMDSLAAAADYAEALGAAEIGTLLAVLYLALVAIVMSMRRKA